jgi:hypothetical protein
VQQSFLILFIMVFLLIAGCKQNKSAIEFALNYKSAIESPIEIPPGQILHNTKQLTGDTDPALIFQRVPALFFADQQKEAFTYCTIIPATFSTNKLTLRKTEQPSPFSFNEEQEGSLLLKENDQPILTYHYGMQLPEGVPKRYKRSTYIHPLYDFNGMSITDDFPTDHYHHRGMSWMWPKTWINDVRYDLWHIYGPSQEYEGLHQVFDEWMVKEKGAVCILLGAKNHWELDDQYKVMDEEVLFRIFRKTGTGRAIDIHLKWTAVEHIKISGQDKKGYGGFNLRFGPRTNTKITTPAGSEESDSDLRMYAWSDFSAQFEGRDDFSGAAIFQHPYNPGFPAGWCLRFYGFLGVAWPGVEVIELNPGESLELRFRVWVHEGEAKQGMVLKAYDAYQRQLGLED